MPHSSSLAHIITPLTTFLQLVKNEKSFSPFKKPYFIGFFELFLYWSTLDAKFKVTGRIVDRFNKCIWENSNNIVFMTDKKKLQMPAACKNKLLMYPLIYLFCFRES